MDKKTIKILPTITTTGLKKGWIDKIYELRENMIQEIALFPTAILKNERLELYRLLKKNILKIPYVHLRSDMEFWEIEYFIKEYETKIFNIHSMNDYPHIYDYSAYKNIIFIENTFSGLNNDEVKKFAGVCIDFSHLETDRLGYKEIYEQNIKVIKKNTIGCNHISAVRKETWIDNSNKNYPAKIRHDFHKLLDLSELDYLKNYPLKYFSEHIAIELENSIEEQMAIKKYIEKIIEKLN